jgi:RNA polymerase-associated protein LEO1
VAKLPNSLMIEPECFVYDEFQGDENAGAPVIRWRYGIDSATGDLVKESNARIITWSDGSQTLNVGKDVFQVKTIDVAGDNAFLYVRHPSLVQCQSKFQEKMLFNPVGVEKSVRPKTRTTEVSRIKVKQTATLVDPVREREEKERAEEARIKDKEKLQEKQKQVMRRSIMQTKLPPKRQSYLSAAFLEEDDDYAADGHLEDDGFIVPDDDEDVEDVEDVDDIHRGDVDDDEGAERLAEIQKTDQQATGERPPISSMGGRIEESEEEEEKEVEEQQPKKKRAVLMDSDSE